VLFAVLRGIGRVIERKMGVGKDPCDCGRSCEGALIAGSSMPVARVARFLGPRQVPNAALLEQNLRLRLAGAARVQAPLK